MTDVDDDALRAHVPEQCKRCGKRLPTNPDWRKNWNETWIASMHGGYLCPQCQTVEEDLDAQIHEVIDPPSTWTSPPPFRTAGEWIDFMVPLLTKLYRTPELLRAKADQLDAVRQDDDARAMTGLMRALADDLQSGGGHE